MITFQSVSKTAKGKRPHQGKIIRGLNKQNRKVL